MSSPLVDAATCGELARLYEAPSTAFRATIAMSRYGFGQGEYKYFAYPLPDAVRVLRTTLYGRLASVANA